MTARGTIYLNRELRRIKKFNFIYVAAAVVIALFALFCGCKNPDTEIYQPNTVFPQAFNGYLKDRKVYVTSVGQSVEMMQLMRNMDAVGVSYAEDSLLAPETPEKGSVVFLVVGCSIKSLIENGLTKESEMERAEEFVLRGRAGKYDIVCWHVGGAARRGETSDSFIQLLFANCSLALFKAEGNTDLKLSDWAMSGGVPYCQIENNMADVLKMLAGDQNV